jgi:DNA repair exonuclease SbcCD ATPase subunit
VIFIHLLYTQHIIMQQIDVKQVSQTEENKQWKFSRGRAWVLVTEPWVTLDGQQPWRNIRTESAFGLCCYMEPKEVFRQDREFLSDLNGCIQDALELSELLDKKAKEDYERIKPELDKRKQEFEERTKRALQLAEEQVAKAAGRTVQDMRADYEKLESYEGPPFGPKKIKQ